MKTFSDFDHISDMKIKFLDIKLWLSRGKANKISAVCNYGYENNLHSLPLCFYFPDINNFNVTAQKAEITGATGFRLCGGVNQVYIDGCTAAAGSIPYSSLRIVANSLTSFTERFTN